MLPPLATEESGTQRYVIDFTVFYVHIFQMGYFFRYCIERVREFGLITKDVAILHPLNNLREHARAQGAVRIPPTCCRDGQEREYGGLSLFIFSRK